MISLLLDCKDHIQLLLDKFEADPEYTPSDEIRQAHELLMQGLDKYLPEEKRGKGEAREIVEDEVLPIFESFDSVSNECWHISLRFGPDVFRSGMDPQSFINYLKTLGEIEHIATITDSFPSMDEADPESCYLGFEIDFNGEVTKKKIEDVFEFVKEDCMIRVLPPGSSVSDYLKLIEELPKKNARIGEILKERGNFYEF